ncbi:MAG: response regulator [Anaerolineae bacterium]|nr:response regulator [Anaerolineae bacterium]
MDKPRILIVEDDLDLSEMLNAYFQMQQYEVVTAGWGEDALRVSQEEPLDLIVLDIRLPDIDGYEVCRQLRSQRQTHDTPILFLTEKRDRVDKLQGLELGVVDYITKPFDIQEVHLRIRNAIHRAEQHSSLNGVTELPGGELVDEQLEKLVFDEGPWAALVIMIDKLSQFRDSYGFLAADDVLRAVALMIRNAVREFGSEDDFVGHLGPEEFLVVTAPDAIKNIRERLEVRMQQSREYFYPLSDRQKVRDMTELDPLRLTSALVESGDGPFDSADALRDLLNKNAAAARQEAS